MSATTRPAAELYEARAIPAEAPVSGVSWPAVIGGAFTAAAVSLILLALGSGFGLASISPWSGSGASATTFTIVGGIWLIVTQWVASGVGGYLTGRLRVKWAGLHTHEVFFRDTANGFLMWAVTTVIGIVLLASAASSVVSGTARVTASVAGGASAEAARSAVSSSSNAAEPTGYFVDSLFRTDRPAGNPSDAEVKAESGRILLNGLRNGEVLSSDRAYLAQLVAARTGLSQADAEKRVNDVLAQAKDAELKARQAADTARKAGAYASIFAALSMLIGAFIACVASAVGGQQRDEYS
jgi:hypothetical protein